MQRRVMQRRAMQRMFLRTLAIAFLLYSSAYGQSLGDVARENRDKQNAEEAASSTVKPRVITNKDLPKDPNPSPGPSEVPPAASAVAGKDADPFSAHHLAEQQVADQRLAEERLAQQRAADQWKRHILAQKNKMATLQARIDQLKASMRPANSTVQYETLPYNRYQAQQLQRVAQIQQQLDEQKRKLDRMQEAARHAGMHTAVHDP
jgi:cell division protein FtsB